MHLPLISILSLGLYLLYKEWFRLYSYCTVQYSSTVTTFNMLSSWGHTITFIGWTTVHTVVLMLAFIAVPAMKRTLPMVKVILKLAQFRPTMAIGNAAGRREHNVFILIMG